MNSRPVERPADDVIERYLLGDVPKRERDTIESLLFGNESFHEAVADAEDALIDRYLDGQLSAADRIAFETHFAASASRREKIAFARALYAEASRSSRRAAGAVRARRVAVAAMLLLATAWMVRELWRPYASVQPTATVAAPRDTASTAKPPVERPPVVLPLQREILRSVGRLPRLLLPAAAATVRLDAAWDLSPARDAVYSATLATVDGTIAWRGRAVADVDRPIVHVDVPAELFKPGDYLVTVRGPGAQDGQEYFFEARAR